MMKNDMVFVFVELSFRQEWQAKNQNDINM